MTRRLRKVRTIATFEFLTAVKRAGYLIATFGMPVFVAAYGAIVAIPAYFAAQQDLEEALYGVVDRAAVMNLQGDVRAPRIELPEEFETALQSAGQADALTMAMGESNFVFRSYKDEAAAREDLLDEKIKGYFVLPDDYMSTGRIDIYSPDTVSLSGGDSRGAFTNLLRERLAKGRVEPRLADRLISPAPDVRRFSVSATGEVTDGGDAAAIVRLAVPMAFIILFLISVLMTSGYLMQGTATEKENKVVDVLLASANPDEILAGKLLGLGGAGLLQIAVWLIMVLGTGIGVVPLLVASGIQIPWLSVALAVPLFLLSFLFFGSLILGTGSLGSNMREAQQLAMVWSLTAALPLMLMGLLLHDPQGLTARVLTWIPFSASAVIMLRTSIDPGSIAWWEVAGSILVLIGATWLAIRLSARLFRLGLLSSGSRPGLWEIIRQARLT